VIHSFSSRSNLLINRRNLLSCLSDLKLQIGSGFNAALADASALSEIKRQISSLEADLDELEATINILWKFAISYCMDRRAPAPQIPIGTAGTAAAKRILQLD
jgi:hypothetical protein